MVSVRSECQHSTLYTQRHQRTLPLDQYAPVQTCHLFQVPRMQEVLLRPRITAPGLLVCTQRPQRRQSVSVAAATAVRAPEAGVGGCSGVLASPQLVLVLLGVAAGGWVCLRVCLIIILLVGVVRAVQQASVTHRGWLVT